MSENDRFNDWIKKMCQEIFAFNYWLAGGKRENSWHQDGEMAWEFLFSNWDCICDGLDTNILFNDKDSFNKKNEKFLCDFFEVRTGLKIS